MKEREVSIPWHLGLPGTALVHRLESTSVLSLLVEREEFPEPQRASQAKRSETVRLLSPWDVSLWVQTAENWVLIVLITEQASHRTDAQSLHPAGVSLSRSLPHLPGEQG